MKPRKITTPRPFKFEQAALETEFKIAKFEYKFKSTKDGYEISSGKERLVAKYKGSVASSTFTSGDTRYAVKLDVKDQEKIKMSIEAGKESWSGTGTAEYVLANAMDARIEAPKASAIRVMAFQKGLSSEFRLQLDRLVLASMPAASLGYYAVTRQSMCVVACSLCAAQLILVPDPTDLPTCLACGLCTRMGWLNG